MTTDTHKLALDLDGLISNVEDLFGEYWNIAYREGSESTNYADEANDCLHRLRTILASLTTQESNLREVPKYHVANRGFRWDSEKQQHVPHLLIEFTPVPANNPNDSTGWKDRDALAGMLAAAPQQAAVSDGEKT